VGTIGRKVVLKNVTKHRNNRNKQFYCDINYDVTFFSKYRNLDIFRVQPDLTTNVSARMKQFPFVSKAELENDYEAFF